MTMPHTWVALATYPLDEVDAERAHRAYVTGVPANPPIDLPSARVIAIAVGCYRCEASVQEAFGTECPGEPTP